METFDKESVNKESGLPREPERRCFFLFSGSCSHIGKSRWKDALLPEEWICASEEEPSDEM